MDKFLKPVLKDIGSAKEKIARTKISLEKKLSIIKAIESGTSQAELRKKMKMSKSSISTIWGKREDYKKRMLQKGINPNYCRYRQCHYPLLEEALYTWLVQARLKNIPLNGLILQQKAIYYAMGMKYDEFEASNGWLDRFKARRNIIFRKICGEERAVNPLVVEDWKEKIPSFLDKYSPSNIYNIDESGLFYKCLPDKTLTFKGDTCSGTKRSKERITFLAGTNMDGSDKLPLLVIGKYAKPRCFRKEKNLSTHYEANKTAWMTAVIFKKYLHYLDEYFGSENKKVLLILDNCPAHHLPEKLENIQVVFLPPNATAKLQPMDMGIILDIKRKYRMKLIRRCLIDMENDRETNITLLDSIELLNISWNSVPKSTIVNCFSLSGFGTIQAEIAPQDSTISLSLEEISRATSNFEQYVHVDDNEQVFAEMTDEEIIKMVTNVPDIDLPEEEEEEEMPSSSQVLSSLKWLKTYSRIFDFTAEEILKNEDFFARYETKLLRNMLKQKKITDYIKSRVVLWNFAPITVSPPIPVCPQIVHQSQCCCRKMILLPPPHDKERNASTFVIKTGSTTQWQADIAPKEMAASDMRNRRHV
ncbi:TIGD4 [Cordylochernes scorpioides]|uniref:TIGD4 n=1 Tax=Cordylochernes scorpioides TaxID=51811 RepID=A0ABY6LHC6_9ARAC|nr:TIGD4 [Cordylochernes scorpioides]